MSARLHAAWRRFWFAPLSLTRLALFRIGVLLVALVDLTSYGPAAVADAVALGAGARTWRPIFLFELIGLEPLEPATVELLVQLGYLALVLGILGVLTRTSCALAAGISILITGLVYSCGKVHHDKVALAFALAALPLAPVGARLSIDALVRRWRTGRAGTATAVGAEASPWARPPVRLTQVTIALGYTFAAVSKLRESGLEWCNGYTLMGHLARHDTALARLITGDVLVAQAVSIATLLVQGSFALVFVFPRARWIYLPAAVGFHLGTWATMDTGPYVTLWFLLIAFVPLERIPAWLAAGREHGRTRAAWRTAVVAVPAALVLWVFSRYLPVWVMLALVAAVGAFGPAVGRRTAVAPGAGRTS